MPPTERIDRYFLLGAAVFCIPLQNAVGEEVPLRKETVPAQSPLTPSARSAQLYQEQFAQGDYVEAAEAAKRLIRDVIANGSDDLQYSVALEKLARAQEMSGDLTAAISNYRSAIQRIERAEDMLAARLVKPLTALAGALAKIGQFREATTAYERAAHITRVNSGPMNLDQCDILAALADLHVKQSSFDKAVEVSAYQLAIYRRDLEETDPRVLAAWRRSGELLSLAGRHHDAQEHYEYAMDNIRVSDGPDSLAQLPLLYELSASFLHHAAADRFTRIEMARAQLERAVLITERNPAATPRQKLDAYLRMGDFMQRYGQWESAVNHYRHAWQQVLGDEELRAKTFNTPVLLTPQSAFQDDVLDRESGAITVRVLYDVDKRGRVDNERVEDDRGIDGAADKALTRMRRLIFRPRFDAGQPVMTSNLVREITIAQATDGQ